MDAVNDALSDCDSVERCVAEQVADAVIDGLCATECLENTVNVVFLCVIYFDVYPNCIGLAAE